MRFLSAFSILALFSGIVFSSFSANAHEHERREGPCVGCGDTHKKQATTEDHRQKKDNHGAQPKSADCAAEVVDISDGIKKASETGIECIAYVFGDQKAGTPSTDPGYRSGGAPVLTTASGGTLTMVTGNQYISPATGTYLTAGFTTALTALIPGPSPLPATTQTPSVIYTDQLSCNFVDLQTKVIGVSITQPLDQSETGITVTKDCTSYPGISAALTAMGISAADADVGKINYKCVNGRYIVSGNSCSRIATGACAFTLSGGATASMSPVLVPTDYYSIAWGPRILNSTNNPLLNLAGLQSLNGVHSTSVGAISISTASSYKGNECADIANYFCHSNGGLSCSFSSPDSGATFISSGPGCADFCGAGVAAVGAWDPDLGAAFPSCPGSTPCGSFMHYIATGSTNTPELVFPSQPILKVASNTCGGSMEMGDTCAMKLYGGLPPYNCSLTIPGVSDPQFTCSVVGDTATFTMVSTKTTGAFIPGKFIDADANEIMIPSINVFGFDFNIGASMEIGQLYTYPVTGLGASPTFVSCLPSTNTKCYYDSATKQVTVVPIGPAAVGAASTKLCFNAHTCITKTGATSASVFQLSQLPSSLSVGPDYIFPIDRPVVGSIPAAVAADFPSFPSFSCSLSNSYSCTIDAAGNVTIATGTTSGSFIATICMNSYCKTQSVSLITGLSLSFANPVYVGATSVATLSGVTTGGSLTHTATYSIINQSGGTGTDPILSVDAAGNFSVTPQPPYTGTFNYKYCVDSLCQIGTGNSEYNFSFSGLPGTTSIPGSYNVTTSFTSPPTGLGLGQFTCSVTAGSALCTVTSVGNFTVIPLQTGSYTLQVCASTTCRNLSSTANFSATFSSFADSNFGTLVNYTLGSLPSTLSPTASFSCSKFSGSGDIYCTVDSAGNITVTGIDTGGVRVQVCASATSSSTAYCVVSPSRTIYDAFNINPGGANRLYEDVDQRLTLTPKSPSSIFPPGATFTDSSYSGVSGTFPSISSTSVDFVAITGSSGGSGTARPCMNVTVGGTPYQNCVSKGFSFYDMGSLNFSSSLGTISNGSTHSRTLINDPVYSAYTSGYTCTVANPAKATCSINGYNGNFSVTATASSGSTSVRVCYGSHCTPWRSVSFSP